MNLKSAYKGDPNALLPLIFHGENLPYLDLWIISMNHVKRSLLMISIVFFVCFMVIDYISFFLITIGL